jgi:hypothetical protein
MTFSVLESGEVRADFGEGIEPIVFMPANLPESLFPQALAKGFITRLQGYTSRLSGEGRTPETLRAAVATGLEDLKAGKWAAERIAGESEISIEGEAAYRYRVGRAKDKGEVYSGTLADAARDYAALTDDQKKKLKAVPRFAAAYAAVKAERQTARAEMLAKKAGEEIDF